MAYPLKHTPYCNTIDIPLDNECGIIIRCSSDYFEDELFVSIRVVTNSEHGIEKTTQLGLTFPVIQIDTIISALRRLQLEEGVRQ